MVCLFISVMLIITYYSELPMSTNLGEGDFHLLNLSFLLNTFFNVLDEENGET